jgi:hypothetical protein
VFLRREGASIKAGREFDLAISVVGERVVVGLQGLFGV